MTVRTWRIADSLIDKALDTRFYLGNVDEVKAYALEEFDEVISDNEAAAILESVEYYFKTPGYRQIDLQYVLTHWQD